MGERSDDRRSPERWTLQAARYLGHGLTWAGSTALFLFLGWLADGWLGTMPLLTIVGAFVGAAAGFYSLYYHVVIEPREREKRGRGGGGGEGRP